jgi:hypothetical protein
MAKMSMFSKMVCKFNGVTILNSANLFVYFDESMLRVFLMKKEKTGMAKRNLRMKN